MNQKREPSMKIQIIYILLASYLTGCATPSMQPNTFCVKLPKTICGKLFDPSCDLPADEDIRYESSAQCLEAEQSICRLLINDPTLSYDAIQAHECVQEVEKADCEQAYRSEFHACDTVFTHGE